MRLALHCPRCTETATGPIRNEWYRESLPSVVGPSPVRSGLVWSVLVWSLPVLMRQILQVCFVSKNWSNDVTFSDTFELVRNRAPPPNTVTLLLFSVIYWNKFLISVNKYYGTLSWISPLILPLLLKNSCCSWQMVVVLICWLWITPILNRNG
jgi:hypothetical protein